MSGCPTSRSYPRTLHGTHAAFSRSPEYAAAMHCPPRCVARFPWGLGLAFIATLLVITIAAAVQVAA